MLLQNILIIDVADVLRSGNDDIIRQRPVNEIDIIMEVLQVPAGNIGRVIPVRREDEETAPFAVQIPGFPLFQMVHQRPVFSSGKDRYRFNPGIGHIRNSKIYHPVTSGKRYSCPAAKVRKFIEHILLMVQVNNSSDAIHNILLENQFVA